YLLRRPQDQRRLIALAAVWNRRQERRIGLDQKAVRRHLAGDLTQLAGILEGDYAAEGEIEAEVEEGARRGAIPAKAVNHPADLVAALRAQDARGVVVGVAQVNR